MSLLDRKRGTPARGQVLNFVEPRRLDFPVLEHPQLGRQPARSRFEQRGNIDVIGAEPHPVLAQGRALRLVERFDIFDDPVTFENAERLNELKGDAAGNAGDVVGRAEHEERRQHPLDVGACPQIEPRLHVLKRRAGELVIGEESYRGRRMLSPARIFATGSPIQRINPFEASTN